MSSLTSTEVTITCEELDSSKLSIDTNSQLIIESTSPDVTISKSDPATTLPNLVPTSNSSVTMKTQVVPVVYIQNSSKTPFASVNKTTGNVIVNNIPQFQLTPLGSNINKNNSGSTTSISVAPTQNVIFTTGRPNPLVIHKPQGNVVPFVPVSVSAATKIAGVLTMLKPTNKLNDKTLNSIQLNNNNLNLPHIPQINTFIPTQSPQQKFVLTSVPKLATTRLTTSTTNSVQPKLALLPMPVPNSEPIITTPKVYSHFKLNDGQLQVEPMNVVMCDSISNENSIDVDSNSDEKLICDEIIDMDSPEKNDLSNKTYELSITEDSTSSQKDLKNSAAMLNRNNAAKDLSKFAKYGVSILKKNYNALDRKSEKPTSLIVSNNNMASVSENKEVIPKPNRSEMDDILITIPAPPKPEKERRRKSTLTCIKEYDEMEVTSTDAYGNEVVSKPSFEKQNLEKSPVHNSNGTSLDESKKNLTSEVEIELIKEDPLPLKVEDCDLQKVLQWDDGIGTLPGTEIKFVINEYNLVEYITESEYKALIEKRIGKAKDKIRGDCQEEMRCLECGCYGLSSDFINPKFCSYDCQDVFRHKSTKRDKSDKLIKKKKKKPKVEADTIKLGKDEDSDDDSVDNSSQDKHMSYPWACKKKGFSWSKYLEHVKAKPAPVKLFKDPFPYTRNGFRPGMKLEGVDPQHPSYFCVLTVVEVVGYRIRLHFDGYPENYDFWCNADSMDIFPMGWCEKYSHVLQPPSGYTVENFNWVQYLKQTKSTSAPKHLFSNRAGQAICPNGFRVGMKLEAVDRKNTSLVCVATIRDMMDNRILVHFDSWDDIYDYWADPTSPYIHPVGWCDQYGHNLTPPNDYPNPESFSWEVYLKERKAVAAPVRAFKQRPACGFKRGMRLECVDRRVPQLIRVATVDDVKEHQIRIHFDGWLDRYSYWVDDDNPDIHPVGWCQKTGHPIEPPLTPDDVYDFLECPTVGCRGQGHIQGPKFPTHSTQNVCPYSEGNLDIEKILPDRLLSPDRSPAAVVPVSREPKECKIKPRIGRPPKTRPEPKTESIEEEDEEPPEKKPCKRIKTEIKAEPISTDLQWKALNFIEESNMSPAEKESWPKHSEFLQKYINVDFDPRFWTSKEVINFVTKLPDCNIEHEVIDKEKIDGEAFLSLTPNDIVSILKVKVGPAIKLYNSIVLLRQQIDKKVFA